MLHVTRYKKQNSNCSLHWVKQNTLQMLILMMIASALVLPGCSSSKITTDENAQRAENYSNTDTQAKQNEGETSNTQLNSGENKGSDTSHNADQKPDTEFDLATSEYIAASHILLKLYTPDTDVLKELGEPEEKTEAIIWGSDGLEHQTWKYPSQGVELDMVQGSMKQGGQAVKSISVSTPCSYKTSRGIGIDSTRDQVLEAYNAEIEEENIT